MTNPALEYINDVLTGKIPVNSYAKKAIERHENDLKRQENANFPYFFDENAGLHPIKVFGILRHGKGKWRGKKYQLMPWWAFVLWSVYGWRHKENPGLLRFTDVYVQVPRKNAKTENMAGVGIYEFAFRGVKDPEIYWFATKKDQSKIGWDRQKEMTRMLRADSPKFARYCDTSTYRIYTNEGLGFVAYLGKDSKGEDGPAPSCGIADEYHAHPTDDMVDVIQTGMGTRDGATMWRITTAGTNIQSPCKRFADYCKQVLDGVLDGDSVFAMIYEMDEGDDWEYENVWAKVNPSAAYVDTLMPYLRDQYAKAKERGGTKLTTFLVKNLNKWETTGEKWLTDEDWMKGGGPLDASALVGRLCFGGLDLASTRDTNALCLFFPATADAPAAALWWFWLPEEEAIRRAKNDGIPYLEWAKEGYIDLTPDNSVDNDRIRLALTGVGPDGKPVNENAIATTYKPESIAFDRWGTSDLVPRLVDDGLKMEPFGQGFGSMSAPTKKLEAMVLSRLYFIDVGGAVKMVEKSDLLPLDGEDRLADLKPGDQVMYKDKETGRILKTKIAYISAYLQHGGNPVARWHCSNVAIEMNAAESIKINKGKATEKVDGMVALVMAIGQWLDYDAKHKPKKSQYEEDGAGVYVF